MFIFKRLNQKERKNIYYFMQVMLALHGFCFPRCILQLLLLTCHAQDMRVLASWGGWLSCTFQGGEHFHLRWRILYDHESSFNIRIVLLKMENQQRNIHDKCLERSLSRDIEILYEDFSWVFCLKIQRFSVEILFKTMKISSKIQIFHYRDMKISNIMKKKHMEIT